MIISLPAHSNHLCPNGFFLQELRRLQRFVESLDASVASLHASVTSLQASVAVQINFLRYCNNRDLSASHENQEAHGYDTDPDDSESLSEYKSMRSLVGLSSESNNDSSAIPTQSNDNANIYRDRSLACISMASESMRSLCATTSVNMIIGSPSSGPVASVDPFATPRPPIINGNIQPQIAFDSFGSPQSDGFLTGSDGQYAYVRIKGDLFEDVRIFLLFLRLIFLLKRLARCAGHSYLGHVCIEISDAVV
jgi:hypothetical protein